jgi:N-acyl-D-amino-acid deacylase
MLDFKILNGKLVDGSGAAAYQTDIGISGDRIVSIGDLAEISAAAVIDASGKIVAPGFIDMHTHSDLSVLFDPHANSKVYDGVTTEVVGNCGIGVAPVSEANRQLLIDYLGTRMIGNLPVSIDLKWSTLAEYLTYVDSHPSSVNVAALLAQGAVRIAEMGFEQGEPTAAQLANMKQMVRSGMRDGAVGFSTGLIYMPGEFCQTDELAEVTAEIKAYGGVYVTHIRTESEGIFAAVDEALTIGRKAGVPVHISHLKMGGQSVWGRAGELLQKIEAANADGIDTTFDLYPYTAGMTGLAACMPPWAFEGGVKELIVRLQDTTMRQKIKASIETGIPGWQNMAKSAGSWERITIATVMTEENKQLEGKNIQEIADAQGKDPFTAIFDLLVAEKGRVLIVTHMMTEQDVAQIIRHPLAMIGSDGMSVSTEGLMSFGRPHPRAFGTHARVLERYVRELKLLSLEDAVKKMTHLPATRLGLKQRGLVKAGYYADLTVFDADKVVGKATFADPKQYSEGFAAVIVNGKLVLKDGVHQEVYAGRAIRKAV